jgi:fucose permease
MCKRQPEKARYHIYLRVIVKLVLIAIGLAILQVAANSLAEKHLLRNAKLPNAELIKAAFAGFMQLQRG